MINKKAITMNRTPTKMNKFGIKAFFPPRGPDVDRIISFSPPNDLEL
jgi:hypothetical protein